MKRACYFGIYDPKHWRTRVVTRGLKRVGYEVIECRVDPRKIFGLRKYVELVNSFRKLEGIDLVVVGFPGYLAVIVARLITRKLIVFDAYISYFDGIRDRKNYKLTNPIMWVAWFIDFLDGLCADVVLTINNAYKDFFVKSLLVSSRKVEVLHKGADEEVFYPRPYSTKEVLSIGWWGSYIPLHGLDVIVDSAKHLSNENLRIHFFGSGQLKNQIENKIKEDAITNIELHAFVSQSELVQEIAGFDIVLGIFSSEPKALRCVTNKVYEAMAMGKPIVTEDSPANREIFTHKTNVYLVEPGNPVALMEAIKELASDDKLRTHLEQNVRKLFESRFTTEKIEEEFVDIINRHTNG